jgi:hypothetical protein
VRALAGPSGARRPLARNGYGHLRACACARKLEGREASGRQPTRDGHEVALRGDGPAADGDDPVPGGDAGRSGGAGRLGRRDPKPPAFRGDGEAEPRRQRRRRIGLFEREHGVGDAEVAQLIGRAVAELEMAAADDADRERPIRPARRLGDVLGEGAVPGLLRGHEAVEVRAGLARRHARLPRHFGEIPAVRVSGPGGKLGLLYLAVAFALALCEIEITLRRIAWAAVFYGALERVDAGEAVRQVGVFGMLIATQAALNLTRTYIKQALRMRWRRALTKAALDRWLAHKAFWHLPPSAVAGGVDNPDQRIAEDCLIYVEHLLGDGREWGRVLQFLVSLIARPPPPAPAISAAQAAHASVSAATG